jgi:hypothetical protein
VIFTLQLIVTNKKIKVMTTFKDLQFKRKNYGGIGAHYKFDNGITISVQAGPGNYSTPREDHSSVDAYSSFEIAMWNNDGEWVTRNLIPKQHDDVIGWVSRDDINKIISIVQAQK